MRRRLVAAIAVGTLGITGVAGPVHAQPPGSCNPTWQIVAAPAAPAGFEPGYGGVVVAISPDNVWFPGHLNGKNGTPLPWQTWMPRWNGKSITTAPAVPKSLATGQELVGASFDSPSDGWIIGNQFELGLSVVSYFASFSAHWDGHRWTTVPLAPSPVIGQATALMTAVAAISATDAWSVGGKNPAAPQGTVIQHWDGRQWSVVPDPASNMVGAELAAVRAVSATDVWAVGRRTAPVGSTAPAGTVVPLVEHYDGTSWQIVDVPVGNAPSAFYAVSASGPDDVWAVGDDTLSGSGGLAEALVEHFDGTSWTVESDLPDLGNLRLTGVYAASPTDVWATEYMPVSAHIQVGMLHYDGTAWTQVPFPGAPEYGQYSWVAGIDGTGPNDVWALGGITNKIDSASGLRELRIAHLTCGGR